MKHPRSWSIALAAWAAIAAVAVVAGMDAPPAGIARRTPTVRDFGAVGDGKADDTAAIQKAVDSRLGDVRFARGVYRITRPIVIELDKLGPTSLIGSGTARIVMAGAGPAFRFVGTHEGTAGPKTVRPNVWLRQRMPTVDGLAIAGEHERACGIEATGTMQLVVTRVHVRGVLHGIHLTRRNRNVIVAGCHLYENRGAGVFLDDCNLHQIDVSACHVSYNAAGGIVVRAGNVRNLQVSGCDIEGNMGGADSPPAANVLIDSTSGEAGTAEVAVVGCTIQHTHAAPGSANIRYVGKDAKGRVYGNLTVADNVLSDVQINVDIKHARGVSIVGNTFWKGRRHNLRVEDSSNVVIGPNVFDRNPRYQDEKNADNGLVLRNCRDVTLTGLHVNGVRRCPAGLFLENCRRANVTSSTVLDCDGVGILLKNVRDSRVSDCLVQNASPGAKPWVPLKIAGGERNMIQGCLFDAPVEVDPGAAEVTGTVTYTRPPPDTTRRN